jgi:hypothetical protein
LLTEIECKGKPRRQCDTEDDQPGRLTGKYSRDQSCEDMRFFTRYKARFNAINAGSCRRKR